MKSGIWSLVLIIVTSLCFAGGYQMSAKSGTEPGYFGAVEAAGYGGGGESVAGISEEMAEYYKSLSEQ